MTGASNQELPRIETSWKALDGVVRGLGPGGLTLTGADGWAVKDHLAHVAAWEHSLLALVEKRDLAEAMGLREPTGDIDSLNQSLWELHRDQTPEQALAYFRNSHARLVTALGRLTDADLQLPYNHYQPHDPRAETDNRPLIEWVKGDTYEHYDAHAGWIDQIRESSAAR